MAKLEATKTIEAKKMNKRNRQTLAELPVTIPYGAILDEVIENRDMMEFLYLGELYCCKSEILRPASRSLDGSQSVIPPSGNLSVAAALAPVTFVWEKLNSARFRRCGRRCKADGSWRSGIRGV